MRLRQWSVLSLALALLVVLALPLAVQTQVSRTVTASAPVHQALTIDEGDYTFPAITAADYDAGYINTESESSPLPHTLDLKSNVPWIVNVKTTSADMGTSDDGTYTKPISDFQYKMTPTGPQADKVTSYTSTYTTISGSDTEIARGSPGGNISIRADYQVLLDWTKDRPGTYSINVTYTIAQQP